MDWPCKLGGHTELDGTPGGHSMIINTRKDLDAAPDDVREQFLNRLASTINKHVWDGSEWVLKQDETSIARFGFTAADFPEAPVPEVPGYNPDKQERERL